eukprot:gene33110-42330_t
MYLDVVEDLLWCLGSADECPATDEPLHTAEEMNTLAFQLRKEVPQSTSLYSQAERLDLNKDDELNLDEVKRLKALGGEIDELLKFDTNGDGLLDSGEIQALKEVSQAKSKLEILKHVESCLTEINDRKGNYFNMFSFIMFVCFYFAILMLQLGLCASLTDPVADCGSPCDGCGRRRKPEGGHRAYGAMLCWNFAMGACALE